jgi:hypothetical protein
MRPPAPRSTSSPKHKRGTPRRRRQSRQFGAGDAVGGSDCAAGGADGSATGGCAGAAGCATVRVRCPKFGLAALHAETSSGATCGSGFAARRRCAVPCMIGRMQSTAMPLPAFAPPRSNPACWQAATICPHAPRRGACATAAVALKTTTAQIKPIRNPCCCMLDTPRYAPRCDSARRSREEGKAKAAGARPAMMSPSHRSNERARRRSAHIAEETP